MKLNLGSCGRDFPGYVSVDIVEPCDQLANLSGPWPWPDSSIEEIRAWDIIEHLPNPVHTMNEAWRVLQPGGVFDIIVPTTDGRGWAQDPGHICWPPWNRNSFFYYEDGNPHLIRFQNTGIMERRVRCAFRVRHEDERTEAHGVSKLHIVLEAVK